jgi:hypothetical protein
MLTGRVELIFVTPHHNTNKLSRKEIQICVTFLIYMQLVFFSCLTRKIIYKIINNSTNFI